MLDHRSGQAYMKIETPRMKQTNSKVQMHVVKHEEKILIDMHSTTKKMIKNYSTSPELEGPAGSAVVYVHQRTASTLTTARPSCK